MDCTHFRCYWCSVPEGVIASMLCKCFCLFAVLLQQTCYIYFSLVAFKHLHTQTRMSAQKVHAGLHPTRPILIRDVRMETTHENALLPWWPARMERCSEGNFLCVCGTNTHIHTRSQKPRFNLIWWQVSVSYLFDGIPKEKSVWVSLSLQDYPEHTAALVDWPHSDYKHLKSRKNNLKPEKY